MEAPQTLAEVENPVQLFAWMQAQPVKYRLPQPIQFYFHRFHWNRLQPSAWEHAMVNSEIVEFFGKFCRGRKKKPTFLRVPSNAWEGTPAMERLYQWMKLRGAKMHDDATLYSWEGVEENTDTQGSDLIILSRILGVLFTATYLGVDNFAEVMPGLSLEEAVMSEPECLTSKQVRAFCDRYGRNKRPEETHSDRIRYFTYFYDTVEVMRHVKNPY